MNGPILVVEEPKPGMKGITIWVDGFTFSTVTASYLRLILRLPEVKS